jgi:uridine phosphorylase
MSRIGESELIINSDGSVFHLHMKPEELADDVIIVGDPGRAEMIASHFETKEFMRQSREFVTCTGLYKGDRITVLSSGIGTDNIDIVLNEIDALANVDFKTREERKNRRSLRLLRVGTCGGVQSDIAIGSYVFSHRSVGLDGLLNWYANRERYTEQELEDSFVNHMGWTKFLPRPYVVNSNEEIAALFADISIPGITVSASGFYGPQGRVIRLGLAIPDFINRLISFRYHDERITNIEMESSAIAGLAAELGHRAGTICLIIADRNHKKGNPNYMPLMEELVVKVLDRFAL